MTTDNSALLISDPLNIRYLTGFIGLAPEEREAYFLVLDAQAFLFVSKLYLEKAKKNLKDYSSSISEKFSPPNGGSNNKNLQIIDLSKEKPIERMLIEILSKNKIKTLEFEKYDITVAEFEKLQKELPGITLVPAFGIVEKMRMIKTPEEILTIKSACALTDECFTHLRAYIKEGQTESEIAWEIETFFHKNGASSSFSPIVAFNEHASEPHYAPNGCSRGPLAEQEDLLCKPSLILIDFGAKIDGYCADMTRVVFLGKPKDEWVKAYETMKKAQQAALDYLHLEGVHTSPIGSAWHGKPRVTMPLSGSKTDQIAKKIIIDAGYPVYPHGLGHGVGLAIHEAPRLSLSKDEPLLPGNVFSVEPGIYIEGKYGIRIEDLVVLTDTGAETLSTSEKGLIIV